MQPAQEPRMQSLRRLKPHPLVNCISVLNAEVDVRLPMGTPKNRQLIAGKFLSTGTLKGISKIVIISDTNSQSIRP
jgi:4-hydroxyphenylpyruvate dioxygenase-like putative hemolysin